MREKDVSTRVLPHGSNPSEGIEHVSRRRFVVGLGASLAAAYGGTAAAAALSGGDQAGGAGSSTSAGAIPRFTHPGLLHTEADFQRMRTKVGLHASPWIDGWDVLVANGHTRLTNHPNPQPIIRRGGNEQNYAILYHDIAAAYGDALRWKVSDDPRYAEKAVEYLDRWSSTLKALGGDSNVALAAGIYGYQFANVGEIMRSYSGWSAAGLAAFQKMMRDVFYPINHGFLHRPVDGKRTHYWANWELCNLASLLAIGVLCDDADMVDDAVTYFKQGAGNGCIEKAVYFVHPGYLGQWQEAGRDQGHTTLGIALTGAICEMAWNQGIDLYGYDNNRFLAGAEYVAKSNLKQPDGAFYAVPYTLYQNCDVTQAVFSTGSQGAGRPCWALVANHYINRKGLAAPYSKRFAEVMTPEGGGGNYGPNSGGFDQLGYGTLTCTRDPGTPAPAPSGLTGYASAGNVVLSWWGCSDAVSYDVKRATHAGGPYTTIKRGIADLLTYTDRPPAPGAYFYAVTAHSSSGESARSNEAKVVTAVQLLAHLSFDEGSGPTAADSSGNGQTGTLDGAIWATGRRGHAASLSGSGAYVALPDNLLTDVSDFTIAAWVFWNGSQFWARIFDLGAGIGRYMMLTPRADHRSNNAAVRFSLTVNGFGDQMIDGPAELPSKRWVHVAVTLAGSTGTLYVDGSPVSSNPHMFLAPFRLGSTTQNWLGKSQYVADPTFNGLIDDFRLYCGALSAAQIVSLMNN